MALSPLLPVRHRQGDFFIADIFDNLPFKDDMSSMEHPLFTLSQKPDLRIINYKKGDSKVEITPSGLGLPTIFDKDILLYCGSHIVNKLNSGEYPPKTIRLSVRDLLVATNRAVNGKNYTLIEKALKRLRGCTITTNIKTGDTEQVDGFGLIDKFSYLKNEYSNDRLIALEVTLSDWFYNSLIAKEVLTIDKEYFRLRKSLDRRLYEISRKHCGKGNKAWSISLEKLYLKSGSVAPLRRFRHSIRELMKTNHLPEYLLSFDADKDIVTFNYRGAAAAYDAAQGELLDGLDRPSVPHQIPPDLLDDARAAVGMGLDYYDLWRQFRNWEGSRTARDIRGGFIGFCKLKAGKMMRA